jgi:hypothetical protein
MILKSNIHSFIHSCIVRALTNAKQSSSEYRCCTAHKTHPLSQHTTCHMIFRDSLLQQADAGWTAAVCCCLPSLGRSLLPWVVWRAVSVYVTTHKQKVSEHTKTLCSTLSFWTHTYLLQGLCNTKSDERGITNRCGRYQLWLTWRYHPSTDRQTSSLHNLTPNPSYVLWILCGSEWHQLSSKTHVTSKWSQNIQGLLVIPTTL